MQQTSLFSTSLLNREPGRYALIAESVLPILLISIIGPACLNPGKLAGNNVQGRPPWIAFPIIWTAIVLMLFFGMLLISMHVVLTSSLAFIGCCYFVSVFACFLWLIVYQKSKTIASQILLIAFTFMLATTGLSAASSYDNELAKSIATLFCAIPTGWLVAATLFNYLEIQK